MPDKEKKFTVYYKCGDCNSKWKINHEKSKYNNYYGNNKKNPLIDICEDCKE